VASLCNGVVLVGRMDRLSQSELVQAVTALSEVNVIGMVANGADPSRNRYTEYVPRKAIAPPVESAVPVVYKGR
jgi:polysaccharide biosynthesis transport protein